MTANKNRANQLMSDLIRKIAEESSEEHNGEAISKAESLARIIWQMSLGWTETEDVLQSGIKVGTRVKRYPPAQWAIKEILDRAEGKAAQTSSINDKQADVSDRITDRTKNRLNALAEVEDEECRNSTTPTSNAIPRHPTRMDRSDNGIKNSKTRPKSPPRVEKTDAEISGKGPVDTV